MPSDVETIQEAINVSIDGDIIMVFQGKYQGNINFNGKTITLLSTLHQSATEQMADGSGQADSNATNLTTNTIIEDIQGANVITFNKTEDTNPVLKKLTITPTIESETTEPPPPTIPMQFENSTTPTVISEINTTADEELIISSPSTAPDEQLIDSEIATSDTEPSLEVIDPGSPVGDTVIISVTAVDLENFYYVYLYCDGSQIGLDITEPLEYSWNTIRFTNGTHTLKAKAYHKVLGEYIESVPINVTVYNETPDVPSVTITYPTESHTVSGSIRIQATHSHPDEMTRLATYFYVNDEYLGPSFSSPAGRTWATEYFSDGAYIVKVISYFCDSGLKFKIKCENSVAVTVDNTATLNPEVNIDNLTDGQEVSGTVTIQASVSDPANMRAVICYVNGGWIGYDSSSPYQFTWNTQDLENGTYTIKVMNYHSKSHLYYEKEITVNVDNSNLDSDNDGMPDWWEILYGLDPYNPDDADGDPDEDEVTNLLEYIYNTDPTNPDTDGDGLSDEYEIYAYGTDPNNPDSDGDSVSDGDEVNQGSDPADPSDEGQPPAVEDLLSLLEAAYNVGDLEGIALNADKLMKQGSAATSLLTAVLQDEEKDLDFRGIIAEIIAEAKDPDSADALIEILEDVNQDTYIRAEAAYVLGTTGSDTALAPLLNALNNPDVDIKSSAALGLGFLGRQEAITPLIILLENTEEEAIVRVRCGEALSNLKTLLALDIFINTLQNDEDETIRGRSALWLGSLEHSDAVPALIEAVNEDSSLYVADNAAIALGMIKDLSAVDTLINALDRGGLLRINSAEALAQIGDLSAAQPIADAIEDEQDPWGKQKLMEAYEQLTGVEYQP
ncbi:MAG: HEAT repeat domain-containing protein [Candidatus Omnitrophica bacterium]|nr:HEAT repeat domain-containing protein [Candidatus Omnitrophota bacterium]